MENKKIIIEGITDTGETFRPSNWAERVSDKLSTVKRRRLHYSPMLQPTRRDGHACVILDTQLKETHSALYQSILDFAENNHLKVCDDDTD